MSDKRIHLSFTDRHKYRMEFEPAEFWRPLADAYGGVEWSVGDDCLSVVAENYSYLLDLLVHARQFYLRSMPFEERFR